MRRIVTIRFGSHLYGTSTPASDIDFKSVYIPCGRDIALQRVKGSISNKRPKQTGEKNYAGEIDEESYSLQRFLQLASEGQTVALDVLFSPEWAMVDAPSEEWRTIMTNRHRLLTKKSAAFIGYVRQQSNKYGIRGSRVAAARAALRFLNAIVDVGGGNSKLGDVMTGPALGPLGFGGKEVGGSEHTAIIEITPPSGSPVKHLEVCGRKMPFTASVKTAQGVMQRLVDEYGHRAIAAEQQEGVDWKALSHAVRVGSQALELLSTGNVTFPLPNAQHILDIKTGKLPYKQVAEEIEQFIYSVEAAAEKSGLPDQADRQWIEEFIWKTYSAEVVATALAPPPPADSPSPG